MKEAEAVADSELVSGPEGGISLWNSGAVLLLSEEYQATVCMVTNRQYIALTHVVISIGLKMHSRLLPAK